MQKRAMHNDLVPSSPTHPGEVLKEEIEARGMTQKEVADLMGRPIQVINMIINGRKGISAETALGLEKAFPEISATFWLQLDLRYRLNVARLKARGLKRAS
ncbi:MAG TPA: HigA family addiction module antitoxin [Armatimonadota bacterium]|jgi:HTH-type transcriptional regulator/antitoxin HigA